MDTSRKNRLLIDLKAERADTKHSAALELAQNGDDNGFKFLKAVISDPPRMNSPENSFFENALSGITQYLSKFPDHLQVKDLNHLAGLEDIYKDVIYYLEDDPLYDVGHDYIHADYSKVRELAIKELNRRENKNPNEV